MSEWRVLKMLPDRALIHGAAALLVLLGCSSKSQVLESEMKIHLPVLPAVVDPHHIDDMYSMLLVIQLHRGLLRFLPEGSVAADLAESWAESSDHLRFEFTLRSSAKFSDGTPILAGHVVRSFQRLFLTKSAMAADLSYIAGAEAVLRGGDPALLGVRAVSDRRVEFLLDRPSSLFLKHLASVDCAVLPIGSDPKKFEVVASTPTSGPYKIESWTQESAVFRKWRMDSRESSLPPQVLNFFSYSGKAVDLALRYETDCLANDTLDSVSIEKLKAKGWHGVVGAIDTERFVILDPTKVDSSTRAWFALRIAQSDIISHLGESRLSQAFGLIPSSLPGHLTREDALSLAAPASTSPSTGKINLEFNSGDPVAARIASFLSDIWKHPNIQIVATPKATPEYFSRMFGSRAQALVARKGLDYPDGFATLAYFKKGAEGSYFFYRDAQVDADLDKALGEFKESRRALIYKEVQKHILKQRTVLPLTFGSTEAGLWSDRVASVPPHPMGFHTIPLEMVVLR